MDGQFFSKQARNSSIELLKIVAIFLIVISHVSQTLIDKNAYVSWNDYLIPTTATLDISNLIVLIFRYFGPFGNAIFFICSAWFLIENDRVSTRKILKLILDIWVISVIICFMVLIQREGNINFKLIIRQFLPTTFANNWYMTCYLLFYPIHGLLNKIMKGFDQKGLLLLTTVSSFLYIVCNFVKSGLFFTSPLLLWIVIYIVLTYFKRYSMNKMDNVKINLVFLIISFTINVLLIVGTNYLGLHISFFNDKVLRWWNNCDPFLLIAAFSLFNLVRNVHFTNKAINYISSMSMLIYIIHENELLRTYYRPALWHTIYNQFGYDHLIFWVFVMSLGVFAFGVVMSMIYHHTLEKVVNKEVDWLLPKIQKLYGKYERIVIGEAYTD